VTQPLDRHATPRLRAVAAEQVRVVGLSLRWLGVVALALVVVSANRFILSGLSAALPHVVEERLLVTANSFSTTLGAGAAAAGDDAVLSSEVGRLNNQSLLWGPYKPNLYFGVRPRLPEGLWSTLMWSRMEGYEDVRNGK